MAKKDTFKEAQTAGLVPEDANLDDFTQEQLDALLGGGPAWEGSMSAPKPLEAPDGHVTLSARGHQGSAVMATAGPKLRRAVIVNHTVDFGDDVTVKFVYDRNKITDAWMGQWERLRRSGTPPDERDA